MTYFAPPPLLGANRTLWRLVGANMNTTADQLLVQQFAFTNFVLDKIIVTNASGAISLAAGGIYTAPSKGGTPIVAAAQLWTGLTSTTKVVNPSLTVAAQDLMATQVLYFSLSTAMGSPATADIYVMGVAG